MHKLFWNDLLLTLATVAGGLYLLSNEEISKTYMLTIFTIYIFSKAIGYLLLPYEKFETFINHLSRESKLPILSGFELFKSTLVGALFVGYIFIDPSYWIIESILVVAMRVWGVSITNKKSIA